MSRAIFFLITAQVCAMSLWFTGASLAPDLVAEFGLSPTQTGALTTAVQFGFVAGGLAFSITGLVDRVSPRLVFAACSVLASVSTYGLLWVHPASDAALVLRFMTGFSLAGVYPVGMTIAVGYGTHNRGLLVGLLVGALTIGSALPHLLTSLDFVDWRQVVRLSAMLGGLAAALIGAVPLGPHHAPSAAFSFDVVRVLASNANLRRAYWGYFGHMWELYAFWAWVGVFLASRMEPGVAALSTFLLIAGGAISCWIGGWWSLKVGKLMVARVALAGSLASGVATVSAINLGSDTLILIGLAAWGLTIIPDSPQFSALVADLAPPQKAGSLITLQTTLGFAITAITIQGVPLVVEWAGWSAAFSVLLIGPIFGLWALRGLRLPKTP